MLEKLKTCPVCNSAPIVLFDRTNNNIVLRCPDMDCDFPYAVGDSNRELAGKRWNDCCEQWDKDNK